MALARVNPMRDYFEQREHTLEAKVQALEGGLWLIIAQAATIADPDRARTAIIETARLVLGLDEDEDQ